MWRGRDVHVASPPVGTTMARAVALLALAAGTAALTVLSEHSFRPPFSSFGVDGVREVPEWRRGGTAEVRAPSAAGPPARIGGRELLEG